MLLPNVGLVSLTKKERFECWQTGAAGLSVIVITERWRTLFY